METINNNEQVHPIDQAQSTPPMVASPALPSTSMNSNTLTPGPGMSKKALIIILVLVFILAGVAYGGIWYWQKQSSDIVIPTFTPRPDPTADWQTYTNKEYGFEFKYPKDWLPKDVKFGISLTHNRIEITKNISENEYRRISFTSSKEDLGKDVTGSKSILAGVEWTNWEFNDGVPGQDAPHDSLAMISRRGETYYQITIYPATFLPYDKKINLDPLFNQILSTF